MTTTRRIVLASRPQGVASTSNFRLETVELPALAPGQVLVRNHFLSLDPYMRSRMDAADSYATPQQVGETMIGGTVGTVAESRNAAFAVGDAVVGALGWSESGISDGTNLRKVDPALPLSVYLGTVGMPGVTAWYGLNRIIEPKAGETVVVSAASGAVGSVVGQLAKAAGCRAVGIAGGADKCRYVVDELKFDACIDYKHEDVGARLAALCPKGIDGYFENVGGSIFDAVLQKMNAHGRIALCGLIASYDTKPLPIENPRALLVKRLKLQGFIISDHLAEWPTALQALASGVASGRIRYRETVAQGLDSAPAAFLGLLKGQNFGKQIVKLS